MMGRRALPQPLLDRPATSPGSAVTWLEAALLGLVQGVFMFVPVSSTAHLVLTQQWLIDRGSRLPPTDAPELILFDLVVHVGTMVSVAVVLRRSLAALLRGAWRELRTRLAGEGVAGGRYLRLVALGLLCALVTGVLGWPVSQIGGAVFTAPILIAVNLVITGGILWWTDAAGPGRRGLDQITPAVAVAIGVAQAAALLPGLSRSGLTIAMALLLGLRRRWAAEFSFFVAIPTIVGGSVAQAALVAAEGQPLVVDGAAFAIGFVVAAVVGAVALAGVLALLYRARFRVFSIYVWLLAAAVASGLLVIV